MGGDTTAVRVLIIDEQPLVRFGLKCLLNDDPLFEVVGDSGDIGRLESLADDVRPDVLVIDPESRTIDRTEVFDLLRRSSAQCKIIILTAEADRAWLVGALQSGVGGYLLKASALEELVQDIRRVCRGNAVLASGTADRLGRRQVRGSPAARPGAADSLSARELEVLQCMAQGMSNRGIANTLHVCEATIKFHVHAILGKLHAANRTEAVMDAARLGLVALGQDRHQRST